MNKFIVGRMIGEGNFGKVRIGVHRETRQKVAIKTIDKEKLLNEAIRLKVQQEIKTLKSINHQHIVQLYEVIEDEENINLVMEFAERGSLLQQLEKNKLFTQTEASIILLDIVEALKYLHEKGIAHRDLKLANILLDKYGHVKIVDFGFSTKYEFGALLSTNCGSPCFASPQLIRNLPYSPQKVDVWAVGVVYYCLLYGHLPFYHHSIKQLFKIIEQAKYSQAQISQKQTRCLFSNLFHKNSQKRLTFLEIFSHPALKIAKILRKRQRKDPQVNENERNKLIRKYLRISSELLEKRLKSPAYDELHTTISLLRKMSLDEIKSLMEKENDRMNSNMMSSVSSFRTSASESKKFQRKKSRRNVMMRSVKSQKNGQNFKYISEKTLMKYSEKLQKVKLLELLHKGSMSKSLTLGLRDRYDNMYE